MNLSKTCIGLEFGSTRIKAVMLDENHEIIAQGFYNWENQLKNGIWTYDLSKVYEGMQVCFKDLKEDFKNKFNENLSTTGALGISGMMHGYLVFDKNGNQLAEFRTWRNTMTRQASEQLTELFNFHVPQRWSIAHIYQAILNNEKEVKDIDFATTLAGYVHYLLTGERIIGTGEASGVFPINSSTRNYDLGMVDKFNKLVEKSVPWKILDILPKSVLAGENAGYLTEAGAKLLDPTGEFKPGVPFCPPEGDMGTGMIATNSVRANTGNASLGTSSNITIITNKDINLYPEIDVITTPDGINAALVHVNNCTTDINNWERIFKEVITLSGGSISDGELYTLLFNEALKGEKDCGGLMAFNYYSGEPITKVDEGRPLIVRKPDSNLNVANFMRMHINSLLATLRIGLEILTEQEKVEIKCIYGHGGFFKTPVVGQRLFSAAIKTPILALESASEGGPYGMALLADYYLNKEENESLADYLDNKIFKDCKKSSEMASQEDIEGFDKFYEDFLKNLEVERKAIEAYK